jgi:hypothetical protein
VLPPQDLLRLLHDPEVRARVWYQVDHVFYLHALRDQFPRGEWVSWVAIHGIQLCWLAVGLVVLARRRTPGLTKLLVVWPLAYLAVYLVYQVDYYYPRHIIAAHLAMGLVTLNALGPGWTSETTRDT